MKDEMPKFRVRRIPATDQPQRGGAAPDASAPIPAPAGIADADNPSGTVKHDDRGNAVWEWASRNARPNPQDTLSTTQPLQILENPSLSLAEDAPTPFDVVKPNPLGVVKGYNPYDSGKLDGKLKKGSKVVKKDLRKLSEWIRLRNQAAQNDPHEE